KCLSPIHSPKHSPPQSLVKPFKRSLLRHTNTPFHRVPQVSQLPPWLCCSMKELQFPLSSMLKSTRPSGNPCPEQRTDRQEKLPSINDGEDESTRMTQNMVSTTTMTQIQGKPKARSKKRHVDRLWKPPRGIKRKQTKEESETVKQPLKKTRLSTKKEVADNSPLLGNKSLKLDQGPGTNNGQVKISLCSVSLSSNNVLARKRLRRPLFTTSTMTSLDEEAKEFPEGTKGLRMKSGKPAKVRRAGDRDGNSLPSVSTRPKRCTSKKLKGNNKPVISFETVCASSSGVQTPANAAGLSQIPPPAMKRKRGRPPKIKQMIDQVSLASNAEATVDHNGEDVEHYNEKGEFEGQRKTNFAKLFQSLPVLPKHETAFQNSSQQMPSSIVFQEPGFSGCSEIGSGTILEPQASVQPQNCGTQSSKETKVVNTPAVKLPTTKVRAPTVSFKKFQELLKHRHQKTRKSVENQESESENEIEKSEGKLLETNEYDCIPNVSGVVKENKGSSQTPESFDVEIDNQENQEEGNQSEANDEQHKRSTSRQNDMVHHIHDEPEPGNVKKQNNIEDKTRENVYAAENHFELQNGAVSAMESMTRTEEIVAPQLINKELRALDTKDSREKEKTDSTRESDNLEREKISVIKREVKERMEDDYRGMETFSKEVEKIQIQQTLGYAVAEDLSGDGEKEEIDVEDDDEEFNMNLNNPTVYPVTAWKENPGIKEVDKEGSTIASIRGFPHDCIDFSQNVKIAVVAPMATDLTLPTPSTVESSTLSSHRITTVSTGSWEPEEDEVEVDVLECSPDIRSREFEAGLEQGVTDLTEEDEDMEEDEIDVTGDEMA
ncbi:hypothetical protein UPYG_G00043820, partial [Umbra pygmaea]